jgi:hypothetical protein
LLALHASRPRVQATAQGAAGPTLAQGSAGACTTQLPPLPRRRPLPASCRLTDAHLAWQARAQLQAQQAQAEAHNTMAQVLP